MARHRERDPAASSRDPSALAIAGGHVGELARVLHLFHVAPHLPPRVVAWSAGAMALTERVVLFHDFVPHGVAQTEVYGAGHRRRATASWRSRMPGVGCGWATRSACRCSPAGSRPPAAWCSTTPPGCRSTRTARLPAGRARAGPRRAHRRGSRRHDPVAPRSASSRSTGSRTASRWTPAPSTGSWRATRCRSSRGLAARSCTAARPTRSCSCSASSGCPSRSRCAGCAAPTSGTSCSSCPRAPGSTTSSRSAAASMSSGSTTR